MIDLRKPSDIFNPTKVPLDDNDFYNKLKKIVVSPNKKTKAVLSEVKQDQSKDKMAAETKSPETINDILKHINKTLGSISNIAITSDPSKVYRSSMEKSLTDVSNLLIDVKGKIEERDRKMLDLVYKMDSDFKIKTELLRLLNTIN